ncbi:hypothetical protein HDV00_010168, partial [Rhizophlyctis rosea]
MKKLPNELWFRIYGNVHDPRTKLALAQTSKFFRAESVRTGSLACAKAFLRAKTRLAHFSLKMPYILADEENDLYTVFTPIPDLLNLRVHISDKYFMR